MPLIKLCTEIAASQEKVFDLARSIDLHKKSMEHTAEEAIAGRTSGLIEMGETVTWRARHFGVMQTLTSKVTGFERPSYFADEMVKGAFKSFRHEHYFEPTETGTLLIDHFYYTSPLGVLGKLADWLFLKKYMTRLLVRRNKTICELAEND
ncbi:SRPBCC family protein [Halocola ammonii]